jgi:hypothetical protein
MTYDREVRNDILLGAIDVWHPNGILTRKCCYTAALAMSHLFRSR